MGYNCRKIITYRISGVNIIALLALLGMFVVSGLRLLHMLSLKAKNRRLKEKEKEEKQEEKGWRSKNMYSSEKRLKKR